MQLDEIKKDLKETLSEKRYNHSIGTMKMAKELALIYGENEKKAEFAGLIHDIAKELDIEEIQECLEKYKIEPDEIEKKQLGLLHSKIGAAIAKEKYEADKEVQNAILYHTTGHKDMSELAKIIYIADKIEENRTYKSVEEIREIAKTNLDKAIIILINHVLQKSIRLDRFIHPNAIDLRNKLLNK